MLDNPDLSTGKMYDVLSNGTEIIGFLVIIVIAIILYLYRYEIGLFIKFALSSNRKDTSFASFSKLMKTSYDDLEKKDFDNKIGKLLNDFSNPVLEEEDYTNKDHQNFSSSKDDISPPNFRSLKTIKKPNEIVYHFVNDGDAIFGYSISPLSDLAILSEPLNNIESNETGYFHFTFNENLGNEILFNLSYYDAAKEFHQLKYLYTISENELTIVA